MYSPESEERGDKLSWHPLTNSKKLDCIFVCSFESRTPLPSKQGSTNREHDFIPSCAYHVYIPHPQDYDKQNRLNAS